MSHRTPENAYELRNPGQASDAAQRALLTDRLAKAEHERRKLLDAYYGGAIDVPTLKAEQSRIGTAIDAAKDRLADLDANLTEQQEILDLAASLATRCGDASGSWSKSQRWMIDVLRPSVPWRSRRGGDAPLVHDER